MKVGERIKKRRKEIGMSADDLGAEIGRNRATVYKYEKGQIDNVPYTILIPLAKALRTTPEYLMGLTDNAADRGHETSNVHPGSPDFLATTIKIPVYGTVPAGIPIEAIEDIQDYIDIPEDWTKHGQYIGLKVSGSSMYPKYLDGDTVIVRVQSDCENKQDAIVYVNGFEATLKTVIKENDGTITLQPVNPEYQSHNYGPGDAPIRILGVVKELRRTI